MDRVDKMIKRGTRARVRVLHSKMSDLMMEAFGEIPFKFGSERFPVKLRFIYDRTVGFCRVHDLLEHTSEGYGGPLVLVPQYGERLGFL